MLDPVQEGMEGNPSGLTASGGAARLESCPFCGEDGSETPHPGGNGIRVGCNNDQCPVRPYTYGIEAHRAYIHRDWNERHPARSAPAKPGSPSSPSSPNNPGATP